jgi:DHA2 family multidrug resistance protein
MIPTALTIVTTRLPPRQQAVGLALFGMTAVLGPVLGPVVGGWLTENLSWHYVFFLNLPIGIGLLALILLGLPQSRLDWSRLRDTDVSGLLGLILGLGALTVVLEEGQRERS